MRFAHYFVAPALVVMLGASSASADTVQTQRTEKTTTYKGFVSNVDPASSTIILKTETTSAPAPTYTYNKETVFLDSAGKIVTYEQVKDSPVTISYVQDGDRVIVTKVEQTGPAVRKETTTTTTETR